MDFVFATCLPGVEPAIKLEVARDRPELRFAFSRPGLVTFKSSRTVAPDDAPGSAFAWVWGRSLGAASDPDAAAHQLGYLGATRLHVFARDPELVTDLDAWAGKLAATLAIPTGPAAVGELVADVVVSPNEPAWLGVHRHDATRSPYAGGELPVDAPEDAPSRAYAKLEQAIAWARLPIERGQVAVEIGSAPGGAALALARRGVEVWCVDTAELAPVVRARPEVHHLAVKVGALRWEQLPRVVDWLLVDVNLAPQVALHEVARLMPRLRDTVRGGIFTLKLNDWSFVGELPKLVERIREMGFARVALRHLPANRREICAVAIRS